MGGIFPSIFGINAFNERFVFNGRKVFGHLGSIDPVALSQAHMVKINLAVLGLINKRIDLLYRRVQGLLDILGKRSQRTVTGGDGYVLIGSVSHVKFLIVVKYLWGPKALISKNIFFLQSKTLLRPYRTLPVLHVF